MTKSLAVVIASFCHVVSFIVSHINLNSHSILAEKKKEIVTLL